MFCVKCGAKMEEGQQFCVECGTKVNNGNSVDDVVNSVKEKSSDIANVLKEKTEVLADKISKDDNIRNVTNKVKSKKGLAIIISAILVVILVASVAIFATRSTPQKTVKNFAKHISNLQFDKAFQETNLMAMAEIEVGSQKSALTYVNMMVSELILEAQKEGLKIDFEVINFTPLVKTKNMVTASVTMKIATISTYGNDSEIETEELKFIKINGKWKIDVANEFF